MTPSQAAAQKVVYTAKVHTTGGRDGGASKSNDGRLSIQHSVPGTPGTGTNPEQLFAAGWSACFEGAMGIAAKQMKIAMPAEMAIDAEVDLVLSDGYNLRARLNVSLPGLERNVRKRWSMRHTRPAPIRRQFATMSTSRSILSKPNRRRFIGATTGFAAALPFGGAMSAQAETSIELPSLKGATGWLNSPPLTPSGLRGRVVLVNFWTYTCINWLRSLPYVRAWAEKYKEQGLAVIGVHSPEFAFERNMANVRREIGNLRIAYPVAVDSDRDVWRTFSNQYWPALYLADARGRIRYSHFGEGSYEASERMIQELLLEVGAPNIGRDLVKVEGRGVEAPPDWENLKSSENYLGSDRTENKDRSGPLKLNHWTHSGDWTIRRDAIALNRANGRIAYRFHARDLHLVMGPARQGAAVRFRLAIDGQPPADARGADVDAQGNGSVPEQRLYQLVRQHNPISDRLFEIEFLDRGVEVFSLTFG